MASLGQLPPSRGLGATGPNTYFENIKKNTTIGKAMPQNVFTIQSKNNTKKSNNNTKKSNNNTKKQNNLKIFINSNPVSPIPTPGSQTPSGDPKAYISPTGSSISAQEQIKRTMEGYQAYGTQKGLTYGGTRKHKQRKHKSRKARKSRKSRKQRK